MASTYGTNPEPITLEQALENAVMWLTKAGTIATEQGRYMTTGQIDAARDATKLVLSRMRREAEVRK